MHIDVVPNRGGRPAFLLRESYREGKKVRKRTLANLSNLTAEQIERLRRVLRGEELASGDELFECLRSLHHGHVEAVRIAMKRIGLDSLVGSIASPERNLVCAMIAIQILAPQSKLAMARWAKTTTLPESFSVTDAEEDDWYNALDWLLARQERIENKLAKRHLTEGGTVLYDLSSSYFEGKTCPLAAIGYSRDGKRGTLQVNYGLLTDAQGRPISVSVFKGNVGDAKTFLPALQKVRQRFGIKTLVIIGDRGMIGQKQIDTIKELDGVAWITALKTGAIEGLVKDKSIQMDLFDERNLFELTHPDFPGERLVACRNPALAKLRAEKRQSLLAATRKVLDKVCRMAGKRLKGSDVIGVRVGKVIDKYKVAKHFDLDIRDNAFTYHINEERVAQEAALDGLYVVRTSVAKDKLSADDTVRSYKLLTRVEKAFRCVKTIDLNVRPIRHRLEDRVRAHLFLCMLAYYVVWHMIEAWRPVLFADEDQETKKTRDPVAPAKRSEAADAKAHTKRLDDGSIVHSFDTLLHSLSGIVRNLCRRKNADSNEPTFEVVTTPDAQQKRALDLLEAITV